MKTFLYMSIILLILPMFASGQEKVDEAAKLMQLDRDFDKATAEKGAAGWAEFFAPNGSMVGDTSQPVTGPAEIRKIMKPLFDDSTFSLRWHPTKAEILLPNLLGYTVGQFVRWKKNKEGKMMEWIGSYSTLWMKQPDGSWKVVFDTGNADGPPKEISIEKLPVSDTKDYEKIIMH